MAVPPQGRVPRPRPWRPDRRREPAAPPSRRRPSFASVAPRSPTGAGGPPARRRPSSASAAPTSPTGAGRPPARARLLPATAAPRSQTRASRPPARARPPRSPPRVDAPIVRIRGAEIANRSWPVSLVIAARSAGPRTSPAQSGAAATASRRRSRDDSPARGARIQTAAEQATVWQGRGADEPEAACWRCWRWSVWCWGFGRWLATVLYSCMSSFLRKLV